MKPGRGRDGAEIAALLSSFRTDRDRAIAGLMLLSRLRNAEVPGFAVADVDVGPGWVRVTGKGDKERRSRSTPTWGRPDALDLFSLLVRSTCGWASSPQFVRPMGAASARGSPRRCEQSNRRVANAHHAQAGVTAVRTAAEERLFLRAELLGEQGAISTWSAQTHVSHFPWLRSARSRGNKARSVCGINSRRGRCSET